MMNVAPDPAGRAAHAAAMLAHKLDFRLLGAALGTATREERAECLERLFEQWPALCRAMAALETAAPNAARKGRDAYARSQDHLEAKAAA